MEERPGQTRGQGQGQEKPIPDWQQETWVSPYPMHENPFDEPEDAPELRDLRSEELNNRSGDFWQTQTSGYKFGQNAANVQAEPAKQESPETRERRRNRGIWIGAIAAAVVIAAVLVFYFWVYTVRTIEVTGLQDMPESEVIRLSGIRIGTPMLSLNSGEIERSIEQNGNLKFRYMEKKWPGTVILRVQEREACCWMTWNGILYTMDKQRTVLFESEDLEIRPAELVKVDGLKIRSGAMVGQTLALDSMEQQAVFTELFLQMKVLSCTALIEEADLSNVSSLLLTTRDGFTIAMGDASDIHAKLRSMLLTREELLKRGYHEGVINVSLPKTPIFSPTDT